MPIDIETLKGLTDEMRSFVYRGVYFATPQRTWQIHEIADLLDELVATSGAQATAAKPPERCHRGNEPHAPHTWVRTTARPHWCCGVPDAGALTASAGPLTVNCKDGTVDYGAGPQSAAGAKPETTPCGTCGEIHRRGVFYNHNHVPLLPFGAKPEAPP